MHDPQVRIEFRSKEGDFAKFPELRVPFFSLRRKAESDGSFSWQVNCSTSKLPQICPQCLWGVELHWFVFIPVSEEVHDEICIWNAPADGYERLVQLVLRTLHCHDHEILAREFPDMEVSYPSLRN